MALAHLSEDRIQDYLDGNAGPEQERAAAHLETCGACREAVREYESLYLGLADEAGFDLPADFAASVAAKLAPQPEPRAWFYKGIIAAVLLLAGTGAVYFFVDLSVLFDMVNKGLALETCLDTAVSAVRTFLSILGIQTNLLVFSGLALLMVGLLDRLVFAFRQGKTLFHV